MRIAVIGIACAALAAFTGPATAQTATTLPGFGDSFAAHHTQAKLILSANTAKPGDTVWAGVDLKMDSGWHTYWKNPGDAGQATEIKWSLPPGITAGEIQWPLPEKLPPAEVSTYGYENEVVLLVPLILASNLPAGPLNLAAKVSWLECKESCIPAGTDVQATLNIGSETKASADAVPIQTWEYKTPNTNIDFFYQAWWEKPPSGDTGQLIIEGFQSEGNLLPTTNMIFSLTRVTSLKFKPQLKGFLKQVVFVCAKS